MESRLGIFKDDVKQSTCAKNLAQKSILAVASLCGKKHVVI